MTSAVTEHAVAEATRYHPDLDLDVIREAATLVAYELGGNVGAAEAVFSPDDGTCYRVVVMRKPPVVGDPGWSLIQHPYFVACAGPYGKAHEWSGNPVDWTYCREKWADSDHTAKILSVFLGYVSEVLS
jgi:hypothetical protein